MSPDGHRILVIDDDIGIVSVLKTLLQREGYDVDVADGCESGLALMANQRHDVVLSDIAMQPLSGIDLLARVRDQYPGIPVIMMTGQATVDTAVQAMEMGAFDYICKPFRIDEIIATVQRALMYEQTTRGTSAAVQRSPGSVHFDRIVGDTPRMRHVYQMMTHSVDNDGALLVLGESGVGKTLVAEAMHAHGRYKDGPLVTFNSVEYPTPLLETEFFGRAKSLAEVDDSTICAGRGALESAQGGTLFLSEIDGFTTAMQERLLALLEGRQLGRDEPVKFQLILSSNEPLERKVERGDFLEELFYRLNITAVEVPPLRERKEDIALLLQHFLHRHNRTRRDSVSIDAQAVQAIESYTWPGNVREFENAIVRACNAVDGPLISLEQLPNTVRGCYRPSSTTFGYSDEFDLRWWSLKRFLKRKERDYVDQVLKMVSGDHKRAAEMLGMAVEVFEQKYFEQD